MSVFSIFYCFCCRVKELDSYVILILTNLFPMQTLFLSLYKSFSSILTERLPAASSAQTLQDLKSINPSDANAMDLEEPSAMEMDNVDSRPEKRFSSSRGQ